VAQPLDGWLAPDGWQRTSTGTESPNSFVTGLNVGSGSSADDATIAYHG
jgi:hypothetical protein